MKQKRWKYEDKYLDFRFTSTTVDNEKRPQCVVCFKVLARESMLQRKLRRQFKKMHESLKDKNWNLKEA